MHKVINETKAREELAGSGVRTELQVNLGTKSV